MTLEINLANLLCPFVDISSYSWSKIGVKHLELDSRKVEIGSTFIAILGHNVDGRVYINEAIKSGANAVIAQACPLNTHGKTEVRDNVPIVFVDDLGIRLSSLAKRLFPLQNNKLIAVTGTNGKTTITQLIAQWFELVSCHAAVLGTTGNGFIDDLKPATNTTGNAIEVQQTLYALEQQGANYTALEVSSHGLSQGRVKALEFEVGIFSNLSRDHLDYHGTMENYEQAKFSLFTQHDCKQAIINIDDPVGERWLRHLDSAVAISLYPQDIPRSVWAKRVNYSVNGISLSFDGMFGDGEIEVALIGGFNANNVLIAMTTLLCMGVDKKQLIATAPLLRPVIGRMELFTAPNRVKVIVDYAHTPDALEKALHALKGHSGGALWVIFGCGGDRDVGKRPMMGRISEELADRVIITDDNPRSEDPALIVKDIQAGMSRPESVMVEHDRRAALKYAIEYSRPEDIILMAGKGHEDYQVLSDQIVACSDREFALELLGDKG